MPHCSVAALIQSATARKATSRLSLEHLDHRHRTLVRDESAVHAIALRPPFVLDDECALHGVEIGVAPAIDAKMSGKGSIESGDRERVLHQRAGIGGA